MSNLTATTEGYKFIQDRLDTREWWLIPVATRQAAAFVNEIAHGFCQGDNLLLVDVVLVKEPTPDLAVLMLILAAKACLSPKQLAEFVENESVDRDILVHGSTPIGALDWLSRQFRWGDSK